MVSRRDYNAEMVAAARSVLEEEAASLRTPTESTRERSAAGKHLASPVDGDLFGTPASQSPSRAGEYHAKFRPWTTSGAP